MARVLWWVGGLFALEAGLVVLALWLAGHEGAIPGFAGAVAALLAQLLGAVLVVGLLLTPVAGLAALVLRRMPARMVDRDPAGEALRAAERRG
jgi:membrane protein implicated in regulation of membrane protease activity